MNPDSQDDAPPPEKQDPAFSELHGALTLVGALGLVMIVAIGVCFSGGLWLGRQIGYPSQMAVAGCLLGTGMGVAWGYRNIMRYLEKGTRSIKKQP